MVDSTMTSTGGSLIQRMIRASRFDASVYEELEADRTATNAAATAVSIVAVAGGIGQVLAGVINPQGMGITGAVIAALAAIVGALLGWVVWSYVTYFIGTRFFGGTATPGELLRTIGFAQSPGVLNVLAFVPVIGPIIAFATAIWSLCTGVVAVRQALDFDTGKAILTTIIGWLFFVVVAFVLALIVGLFFAGIGAATGAIG